MVTPDRELVQAVMQEGDEAAFRELYRRYTPRLLQTALRLLGQSEMDAEDAVQDTWVRAVREFAGFRWQAALGTWLTSIACNVARDQLRKRRRQELDLDQVNDPGWTPAASAHWELEQAIARLPDGYRVVLVMHDIEGFTHEEIGATLGIAPGTSKSQLFGARRSLRAMLTPAVEANNGS